MFVVEKIVTFIIDNSILITCSITLVILLVSIKEWTLKLRDEKNNSIYREYLINKLEKVDTREIGEEIDDETLNQREIQKAEAALTVYPDITTKQMSKKDIIALMLKNNDEIAEYFKISKKHAKSSFKFSIIASMVGILMLGLAIYGTIIIEDTQLAIIGLVSGSITEVISGTVLWIHNKSALQLNHYYDALHQNEKFLSAVNMADKLNEEKREEMYIEIIRKQIEINN